MVEDTFERLTALVARVLGVPLALVSLVESDRQCFVGLHGDLPDPWGRLRETPLSHSLCQHVVATAAPLVIEDARLDAGLRDHPAIRDLGVIAYLGVPLATSGGAVLGSLCAIDRQPRRWTPEELGLLTGLAGFAAAELDLRERARGLESTLQGLRSSQTDQEEQTFFLVHDLRTPLSNLLLGLRMLPQLGKLNAEQQEILAMANRGGETLLALVNAVLEIGARDAGAAAGPAGGTGGAGGGPAPAFRPTSPAELLQTARQQVAALARAQRLRLVVEEAPGLPARVDLDADRVVRALVNLLSNAVKFTPPGGTVHAQVEGAPDGNGVVYTVQDTGRGIAPADQARIFEPFVRLVEPFGALPGARSSGLGLALVKAVAQTHEGSVTVRSVPGEGSTFTLRLSGRGPLPERG